jgi:hypothetical protein
MLLIPCIIGQESRPFELRPRWSVACLASGGHAEALNSLEALV